MDLNTAADICRPLDNRTFRDQTLDLADELIGAENLKNAKLEAQAAISPAYRAAARELFGLSTNLVAYSRGTVGKQVVPSYIKQAREALDVLEGAL